MNIMQNNMFWLFIIIIWVNDLYLYNLSMHMNIAYIGTILNDCTNIYIQSKYTFIFTCNLVYII